jgi:hypothetical protein
MTDLIVAFAGIGSIFAGLVCVIGGAISIRRRKEAGQ